MRDIFRGFLSTSYVEGGSLHSIWICFRTDGLCFLRYRKWENFSIEKEAILKMTSFRIDDEYENWHPFEKDIAEFEVRGNGIEITISHGGTYVINNIHHLITSDRLLIAFENGCYMLKFWRKITPQLGCHEPPSELENIRLYYTEQPKFDDGN